MFLSFSQGFFLFKKKKKKKKKIQPGQSLRGNSHYEVGGDALLSQAFLQSLDNETVYEIRRWRFYGKTG